MMPETDVECDRTVPAERDGPHPRLVPTQLMSQSSPADADHFAGLVPHQQLLSCIHCGLCTSACPTYLETGNENDGPRGRIHLMRGVEEKRIELTETVRGHLDLCLDCRACETACPSGVEYGQLIETFRVSDRERQLEAGKDPDGWFEKFFLHDIFPDRRRLDRLLWPAWLMQKLRIDRVIDALGLTRILPQPLQRMHRMLPRLQKGFRSLPPYLPHQGERRQASVGLFLGCVSDAMFRRVHWATARVLQKAGCDVHTPDQQQCCGAIEFHAGQRDAALKRAETNRSTFTDEQVDVVIVNVAGCGAMLKEYTHFDEADGDGQFRQFAGKVRDINEFLAGIELPQPTGPLPLKVVYQDACHLRHAQQIAMPPRTLLQSIPGLELKEIAEATICCGAAGSYNLQQPEMADRLGDRKLKNILAQEPDVIATANAGCALQLTALLKTAGFNIPVVHPIELLDASYREIPVARLLKSFS